MNRQEIVEKLTEIFHEVFADNTIVLSEEMTANDVDNWDSMTHMVLITTIEKNFCIKFKLRDLNKMKKVGDLVELISSKL